MDKSSAGYTTPGFPSQANVNHLETGSQPLSRFMQGLQQSYTQYFNRKHRKIGHLSRAVTKGLGGITIARYGGICADPAAGL
jgi:hypothetical protein